MEWIRNEEIRTMLLFSLKLDQTMGRKINYKNLGICDRGSIPVLGFFFFNCFFSITVITNITIVFPIVDNIYKRYIRGFSVAFRKEINEIICYEYYTVIWQGN